MTAEALTGINKSRIRTKAHVEVEIVLVDGTKLTGFLFIGLDERVFDMMNDHKPFLLLKQANHDELIVNKSAVAICRPLEQPAA